MFKTYDLKLFTIINVLNIYIKNHWVRMHTFLYYPAYYESIIHILFLLTRYLNFAYRLLSGWQMYLLGLR